jgi:hypothetical protein
VQGSSRQRWRLPAGFAYYLRFADADPNGVRWAIDRDGFYVNPRHVAWRDIAAIYVFEYWDIGGESSGWQDAVTLQLKDSPQPVSASPLQWGLSVAVTLKPAARAALARHAPRIPVHDLGRVTAPR